MRCYDEMIILIARVEQDNRALATLLKDNEGYQRLLQVPGFGPILASAVIAGIGNGAQFSRVRQIAAWLGLTARGEGSSDRLQG